MAVFPTKGDNMALPHLVMLKFILKNNTDWTLLTKRHVPWMHSPSLNIYPEGNTAMATKYHQTNITNSYSVIQRVKIYLLCVIIIIIAQTCT